jgi:plastocyanin
VPEDQLISRRRFVSTLAASTGLIVTGGVAACGADMAAEPEKPRNGRVLGRVLDGGGTPQPLIGTVYLLYPTGLQSGRVRIVDPFGGFDFEDVPPGDWQLRFSAPGIAYVPAQFEHPRRFIVQAGIDAVVDLTVERAEPVDDGMIEIYVGDYFFQEQPNGKQNAETIVVVGTAICWYNVGLTPHIIAGSWGNSPVLEKGGNYIWTPAETGLYTYRCSYHPTHMIATVRVVEELET